MLTIQVKHNSSFRTDTRHCRDFCRLVGVSFDELPDYLSRWVDEEES
ncbi:MAG: hypothetical protein JGK03_27490 [Microcoleus sp. PH2017_25_DOB_D_A]|nr:MULTISPECIES: hypothetical protein [unclassified Microcoleus]MCC3513131.1 hypothetical protein [Microcoleus sp. PH2017_17_BER_D_A]MCC3588311.1 hypothetical protein [Microcoleus sp. PH2017_30_WIL_O_A]MCC3612989.1 hypothetical protein [Microcoleus sp. PH2017_40_RAT_O_B]MCC3451240.1 hypothetical protein [Microcoleus sp. PH2017_09_SFU_O_A]MCC3537845.1 hypothetical protein [Microcoleus sp. PH2017_25_DOB_D_A]